MMIRTILFTLACSSCCVTVALDPLTHFLPNEEELQVFPKTLLAALSKIASSSTSTHSTQDTASPIANSANRVVHIVGASDVEDAVDWSGMCQDGFTLVLVGPMVSFLN